MLNENDAKKEIKEILNTHEFKMYEAKEPNIIQKWWSAMKEWLIELLIKWFPSVEKAEGIADTILIVVLLLIVLILLVITFLLVRNRVNKRRYKEKAPLVHKHEMDWTSDMHIKEAETYELAGDYSLATRHLFLGHLLYLHEKNLLEAKIWKTNWEYYEELRKENDGLAKEFQQIAQDFEDVTYGYMEMSKEDYEILRQIVIQRLTSHSTNREGDVT